MPPPDGPQAAAHLISSAAAVGCPLSTPQAHQLLAYLALLLKWNRVHNLTAITSSEEAIDLHLLDCLAILAPLRRYLGARVTHPAAGATIQTSEGHAPENGRLLDIGSGAGLPGVVIAIAAPHLQVVCVDAVAKKAAFITQAQSELGLLNLTAKHARVEQLHLTPFDVITSRAVGSLRELVALSRNLLRPDGAWMAMKGAVPTAEIAEVGGHVEVFHVEQLHVPTLRAQRCLVWMRPVRDPKPT